METKAATWVRSLRARYWVLWHAARWRWRIVWTLRFNMLIAAVTGAMMFLPEQGREALQVLVQDGVTRPFPLGLLVLAAVVLSASLWYWSLNLVYVTQATLRPVSGVPDDLDPPPPDPVAPVPPPVRGPIPATMDQRRRRERRDAAALAASPRAALNHHSIGATRFSRRCCGVVGLAPVVGIVMGFALRAVDVYRAATPDTHAEATGTIWRLIWGAGAGIATCVILYGVFSAWRRRVELKGERAPTKLSWMPDWLYAVMGLWFGLARVPKTGQIMLPGMFALGIGVLIFFTIAPTVAVGWGPMTVVMIAGVFWVAIGSPLVIAAWRLKAPVLLAFFLLTATLFGLFGWNDNHQIRRLPGPPAPPPPQLTESFSRWLLARPDFPGPESSAEYPVFLVATEGGGIRNAYLTAAVLGQLDGVENFRHHLYAVSGVSGGSVGAAVHAAVVARDREAPVPDGVRTASETILADDLLSPLLAKALFPDLLQRFVPFPVDPFDRARGLEVALEASFRRATGGDQMSASFGALRADPASDAPVLILNTTQVDTGERVPVSHVRLVQGVSPRVRTLDQWTDADIRLSTAAFLSARFPIVTPAAMVRSQGRKIRLVDGGYFENSGAATLLDVLHDLARFAVTGPPGEPQPQDDELRRRLARVRYFVIRIRYVAARPPEPGESWQGWEESLSPLRAMLRTREARGQFSRDALDLYLSDAALDGRPVDGSVIAFEVSDAGAPLPLGWLMSRNARQRIDDQLDGVISPQDGAADAQQALGRVRGILAH